MKVIGFCGLPGSGKSTAIDAIREIGVVVTMGDVIRNEAKKRGTLTNDENLGKIARELRDDNGPEIIAEKCVELIKNLNADIIFVDGVRSSHEVNVFRKHWKFPLIAITLDEKSRFTRLYERGRSDDPKTLSDLKLRDAREISFGIKSVVDDAEYKISNDSTVDELIRKTRRLVSRIISNYNV